jgi:prepilin-type N-terminal cleavage/methylation domain-containing protein
MLNCEQRNHSESRLRARRRFSTGHCPPATDHCSSGFSLVELLIALTIGAVLLLAAAVALDATVRATTVNVDTADGLQKARLGMSRMLDEVRTGRDHTPISASQLTLFRAGTGVTDGGVAFTASDGQTLRYSYDATAKTISMQRGEGAAVVLARRVDAFSVQLIPTRSEGAIRTGASYDLLTRATISVTLRPAETSSPTTLSASVAPRQQKWE